MPKPTTPTHAKRELLGKTPRHFRTPPAKGLDTSVAADQRVVRDGGDFNAGLIRGCSLCTRGEALGHEMWLDAEFIASVTDAAMSAGDKGIKARFTHPSLSGDGLGSFLGRFKAHRLSDDGQKAVGDLHFSTAAHRSPDGDLAQYVMDLAENDPESFAVSISFDFDRDAECEFALEHGAEWDSDPYCGQFLNFKNFKSPDPDNEDNLLHARLKKLWAADMVDEPAANPDGLFHREQQFAQEADAVVAYALGLSDQRPVCTNFDVDPDRVKGFVARFCEAHDLELTSKENSMTQTKETKSVEAETLNASDATDQTETTDQTPDKTPDESTAGQDAEPQTDAETGQADEPNADENTADSSSENANEQTSGDALSDGRSECQRFLTAFGSDGATWFAEGLSFADAQEAHSAKLAAENAQLRERLAAAGEGETEPVTTQPASGEQDKDAAKTASLAANLGENIAKVAAGIKIRRKGD